MRRNEEASSGFTPIRVHLRESAAQTLLFFFILHLWLAAPANAQILQADWTREADRLIEKHRKIPVRVIVLDRDGKPVPNAAVHFELKRHAFQWGAVPGHARSADPKVDGDSFETPRFRGQSAISMEDRTHWAQPESQPSPGTASLKATDLYRRWGVVVPADPGKLPDAVASLRGEGLKQALQSRVSNAVAQKAFDEFDLYADSLTHDFVGKQFGPAMVRRLYESAHAIAPHARLCARFSDVFEGDRSVRTVRKVTAMREGFVPLDAISIEARFQGTVVQTAVKRQLDLLAGLKMPIVVARLEVGGESEAAAAINLETVLRTFFAEPMVQGVYLVGFSADEVGDPNARLRDDHGRLTASGRLLEKLVSEVWRTDAFGKSDHLGNARARVFAGAYEITAALPGERTPASITVNLPPSEAERIVVLQPLDLRGAEERQPTTRPQP
jgi:endo-1,4-beta-xylanase